MNLQRITTYSYQTTGLTAEWDHKLLHACNSKPLLEGHWEQFDSRSRRYWENSVREIKSLNLLFTSGKRSRGCQLMLIDSPMNRYLEDRRLHWSLSGNVVGKAMIFSDTQEKNGKTLMQCWKTIYKQGEWPLIWTLMQHYAAIDVTTGSQTVNKDITSELLPDITSWCLPCAGESESDDERHCKYWKSSALTTSDSACSKRQILNSYALKGRHCDVDGPIWPGVSIRKTVDDETLYYLLSHIKPAAEQDQSDVSGETGFE